MKDPFGEEYLSEIRKSFPAIERDFKGSKRIFLDNGAGSLVLKKSAEAEYEARIKYSANTSAKYSESEMNEEVLEKGRKDVSYLLNARSSGNIFQGESASANLFKFSYAIRKILSKDHNVVTTSAEHFANVAPYMEMKKNQDIGELRIAGLNREDGIIDMDELSSMVDGKTKVVAVTAESNLLGNKSDLKEISKLAHENDALLVVDGVHYAPQALSDVQGIECDLFVFSTYKIFGPRGSFAYVSEKAIQSMHPYNVDRNAAVGTFSYFELGTKDQALFAAISAVVDYISSLSQDLKDFSNGHIPGERKSSLRNGMRKIEEYQDFISDAVLYGIGSEEGLTNLRNVKLYGITEEDRIPERGSTFSFKFSNLSDQQAEEYYWKKFGITVVGGNHWNLAHDFYSEDSMLRVTFLHYNSIGEVEAFLRATKWISEQ